MKHLIVLDGNTPTGKLFLDGKHDGLTSDGTTQHPLLDCIAIDLHIPGYIHATRTVHTAGGSHQNVYLPHGTVVAIFRYAVEETPPLGFLPQT